MVLLRARLGRHLCILHSVLILRKRLPEEIVDTIAEHVSWLQADQRRSILSADDPRDAFKQIKKQFACLFRIIRNESKDLPQHFWSALANSERCSEGPPRYTPDGFRETEDYDPLEYFLDAWLECKFLMKISALSEPLLNSSSLSSTLGFGPNQTHSEKGRNEEYCLNNSLGAMKF